MTRAAVPTIAAAYLVMLIGSNLPSALYPEYAATFGMSALSVALVYSTYALVVLPCLLVFGPLGDAAGRRPILLGSLVLAVVAAALFASAQSTAWLFGAQVVEGVAMGALQANAVAALTDAAPQGRARTAALVGSAANVTGTAAGPVVAGLLATFGGWAPLRLPFVVEIGLLIAAFVLLAVVVEHRAGSGRVHIRLPRIPPSGRAGFLGSAGSAGLAWGVTALFLSLVPAYVAAVLGTSNLALIGTVVAVMLGSSAITQLLAQRMQDEQSQILGIALLALGVLGLIPVARTNSLALVLAASVVAGLGQGLAFRGALSRVDSTSAPERRGAALALLYVAIYVAEAVATIGVGLVATVVGERTAVQAFAVAVAVLGLVLAVLLRTRLRVPTTAVRV